MDVAKTPWPHAPTHHLSEAGTYMVTAGTLGRAHHFRGGARLQILHRGLLKVCSTFGWTLEAWAVFSNHYHFVANAPTNTDGATSLSRMLGTLHAGTAQWVNQLDRTPGRQVWHNFWETRLTFPASYRARLNYVNQNAVRHGLVSVANQYPWCSAAWLERTASPAQIRAIYKLRTDRVQVLDFEEVAPEW